MCRQQPMPTTSQRYLRPAGGRESVRNMKQYVLKEESGQSETTTTRMTDLEAEIRYLQRRKNKKTTKPPVTTKSLQIDFIIQLRKNRPLMKNWYTLQKFVNMGEKQMKNMIMSLAFLSHAATLNLVGNNTRTKQLGSGLSQIMGLIIVPFIIPPGVVIGIPALILFMPIILLGWAFTTLNRRANKILWSRRLNQPSTTRRRMSISRRVSRVMKQATSQLSFRTSLKEKKKESSISNKKRSWSSYGRNRSSSGPLTSSSQSSISSSPDTSEDTASVSDESLGPSCAYSYNNRHNNKSSTSNSRFTPISLFKPKGPSSRNTSPSAVPPRSKTWSPSSSTSSSSSSPFSLTTTTNSNKPPSSSTATARSKTRKESSKLRSKSWPSLGRRRRL